VARTRSSFSRGYATDLFYRTVGLGCYAGPYGSCLRNRFSALSVKAEIIHANLFTVIPGGSIFQNAGRLFLRNGPVMPARLSLAEPNRFHHNLSNARTPQNGDSCELVKGGCVQLSFEPGAILVNSFQGNLQLRCDFRGCFAVTK
jgi:hypothetical protein